MIQLNMFISFPAQTAASNPPVRTPPAIPTLHTELLLDGGRMERLMIEVRCSGNPVGGRRKQPQKLKLRLRVLFPSTVTRRHTESRRQPRLVFDIELAEQRRLAAGLSPDRCGNPQFDRAAKPKLSAAFLLGFFFFSPHYSRANFHAA